MNESKHSKIYPTKEDNPRARDAGAKAGFPDINLPIPRGGYAGLYIELKTDKGKLSPEQKRIMSLLDAVGHLVLALKGSSNDPTEVIVEYLKGNIVKPQSSMEAPDVTQEAQEETQKETQLQEDRSEQPLQISDRAAAGSTGPGV